MTAPNTDWHRFAFIALGTTLALLISVGLINYAVDPQWTFLRDTEWARYQRGFDERQQKTNALTFLSADRDGIILGNSRVTYMSVANFPGRAYNFATSSMTPDEYLAYAQFLTQRSGAEPKRFVLGESFVATHASALRTALAPQFYIDRAMTPLYRYRSLISLDLLRQSIETFQRNRAKQRHKSYVRVGGDISHKQMVLPRPATALKAQIEANVKLYRNTAYGRFSYDSPSPHYARLKNRFPRSQFMVYTTPVTAHLLRLIVELDLVDEYIQWLRDLVESWGSVWHFMTFNSVTRDDRFFADAHHHSPEVTGWIADRLQGRSSSGAPADFGIRLTMENIDAQLKVVADELRAGAAK